MTPFGLIYLYYNICSIDMQTFVRKIIDKRMFEVYYVIRTEVRTEDVMKKLLILFAAALIIIGLPVGIITAIPANAQTQDCIRPEATYNSIKIGQGETLESIAREYNSGSFYTTYEYIDEIKRINNLCSDKIHAGCYLTVFSYG